MKDMFDRHVLDGDVVVYMTRSGSSMYARIAKVLVVEEKRAKVTVFAGTGYQWKFGTSKWDAVTKTSTSSPFTGYTTWIRASHNVLVANGIDHVGMRMCVQQAQHDNMEAAELRRKRRDKDGR